MINLSLKSINDFDDIWLHNDFLDTGTSKLVNQYLHQKKDTPRSNFEGRVINHNDKKFKLIGTTHYRPYIKLWDFSHEFDYWNQTNSSVSSFVNTRYSKLVDPIPRILINKILSLPLFQNGEFIAIRGIFNLMMPGTFLDPHLDGGGFIVDDDRSNIYSVTYYSEINGEGGEFWDERGFMYKPMPNSLLINIGNKTTHGVRTTSDLRLGMTIRVVNVQDLLLTGNVQDLLYKPNQ